jgi:hypothetical protein
MVGSAGHHDRQAEFGDVLVLGVGEGVTDEARDVHALDFGDIQVLHVPEPPIGVLPGVRKDAPCDVPPKPGVKLEYQQHSLFVGHSVPSAETETNQKQFAAAGGLKQAFVAAALGIIPEGLAGVAWRDRLPVWRKVCFRRKIA